MSLLVLDGLKVQTTLLVPAAGGGGGGTDQWPAGVIDFALTIDFSKVWNFT